MDFLLCNKWTLTISDELLAREYPSSGDRDRPFIQYAQRHPKDVARGAWTFENVMQYVDDNRVDSVADYFGGIGRNATQVQRMLTFEYHIINDISEYAVEHLQSLPFERCVIENKDSYVIAGTDPYDCDLICLGFNRFTMLQWMREKDKRHLIDKVMGCGPRYVVIADSAISRIHLNAKTYAVVSGQPVSTWQDYVDEFSCALDYEYNYWISAAAAHKAATYLLIQPRRDVRNPMHFAEAPPEADTYFRRV